MTNFNGSSSVTVAICMHCGHVNSAFRFSAQDRQFFSLPALGQEENFHFLWSKRLSESGVTGILEHMGTVP
jgi:hypothetical protein